MIFLRPNNIFEFLFQSLINVIFRFRQSIKKRLVQEVENNIFNQNIHQFNEQTAN